MQLTHFIALLSLFVVPSWCSVALGNLAVVIKGDSLISSDDEPVRAHTGDLWCQASKGNNDIQDLTWARFVRSRDRKHFDAVLDHDQQKARLVLGDAAVTEAGKYRCELRTTDGDLVYGNMFAYSRPVIHTNGSLFVKMSDHDELLVEADPTFAYSGSTVTLNCPVVGYPIPLVIWYKDGLPLEDEDRVSIHKNHITIADFEDSDAGKYRCVATNQFPTVVDGAEQEFELKMDQELKMTANFGWALPLVVILIIFILLFIIIYSCQAYKRYKADQYHVARQEENNGRCSEAAHLTKQDV